MEPNSASAMQSVARRCPACGNVAQGEVLERSYGAGLYACSGCDLQFWYPVKMPGAAWYEATYQGRDTAAMALEPGHIYFLGDPHAPKTGTLLDLGCGNGNFLAAARDAGFEVSGVEPDQRATQFARDHYGVKNVFAGVPKDFVREHPNETFDVVTFFEVLEHQEDPQTFLEIAKSLLEANGCIALSVPNRNRWQTGIDTLDYPPNHLTRWSPKALRSFLERNELEVLSIRTQPLTVQRVAQMLSGLFTTGMLSRVAREKPPTLAEFSDMPTDTIQQKLVRLRDDPRQGLAARLAVWKLRVLTPLAFFLLPLLRLRGLTGPYLYCLVRKRPQGSVALTGRENEAGRKEIA
jgi:2-polyprenyl-3-methyl-5-hydroxy-6-metoxy-1,4-benzoquinol methylase